MAACVVTSFGGVHQGHPFKSGGSAPCGPACGVLWGLGAKHPRLPDWTATALESRDHDRSFRQESHLSLDDVEQSSPFRSIGSRTPSACHPHEAKRNCADEG